MKLRGSLYQVVNESMDESSWAFTLELDDGHIVYQGHFPGHPVTPGVIQMKIIEELLEWKLDRELVLSSSPKCKFLFPIDPTKTRIINVQITLTDQSDEIRVKSIISSEHGTHCSFSAIFK